MNIHDPKLAPKVTTGAIPGSRKVHVEIRPGLTVAMREVPLDKSANEKPLRLYDTSGPYSDEGVQIDVMKGLPEPVRLYRAVRPLRLDNGAGSRW